MKIVVLGGGLSTERQVSLVTSTSVCKALRSLGHKAIFVDSFLGIENNSDDLEKLFDTEDGLCGNAYIERTIPNLAKIKENRTYDPNSKLGKNVIEICKIADCVFLGLHGEDGEDGKLQAMFDLLGIPYTGSGQLGSAMAMDKTVAKAIMKAHGIKTAPFVSNPPCVVKCAHGGSSIGTFICNTKDEFEKALNDVKQFKDEVIIERKIEGIELTVPVLDGKALSPIEIIPPNSGKFDYIAKYQNGGEAAQEICPARLSEKQTKELQNLAEKLHTAMKLKVYSRSDFIMDYEGNFWCLEVNTLPGMTPNSLIPKAAKNAGIDYSELCEKIVTLSMQNRDA